MLPSQHSFTRCASWTSPDWRYALLNNYEVSIPQQTHLICTHFQINLFLSGGSLYLQNVHVHPVSILYHWPVWRRRTNIRKKRENRYTKIWMVLIKRNGSDDGLEPVTLKLTHPWVRYGVTALHTGNGIPYHSGAVWWGSAARKRKAGQFLSAQETGVFLTLTSPPHKCHHSPTNCCSKATVPTSWEFLTLTSLNLISKTITN